MHLFYLLKGKTIAQQVDYDYDNILARIPDPKGAANFQGILANGTQTWSKVAVDMVASPEYTSNWGTSKVPGNGRPMTCPCFGMTNVSTYRKRSCLT